MSYRDWGRGEDGPRERQPVVSWDVPADPAPVTPYEHAPDRHRTPSRRRAAERGQREPEDSYLPRWALESGVRRADGGRHAAPDDEVGVGPYRSGGWRTTESTSSWHRVSETSWRETPTIGGAEESEHTGEWTFDRPQEQGYSGRRRAADDPAPGVSSRTGPRRLPSERPRAAWPGAEAAEPVPTGEAARPARQGGWAAEGGPSVDLRESRGATPEAAPPHPPAVDPWDASGVRAWHPTGGTDRWDDHAGAVDRWDRTDGTGQWERYPGAGGWDRTVPPVSGGADASWPGRHDGDEDFWSGDDPWWVAPSGSTPRSSVVPSPAPRPRPAPGQGRADPEGAARGAAPPGVRRQVGAAGPDTGGRRIEDDLLDADAGGPWRPLLYTVACYLVPAVLVFVWLLTLDGQVPAGCVTDVTGGGCASPQSRALGSLAPGLPRFGLALASSLVVALLLRGVGATWRAGTVALAAAVVGGGLSTVMISAITGQPLG
ncbi:hypothetical protein [Micromonospora sp. NPDC047074]|uniref:hypothetical protein n=1 Tax=Micromonospora sp. NPDC047074 TaxID=3154339 RepID=UPI0033CCC9DA